ncbi:MAG: DUF6171 family protein [Lachnospiraceae bacterium]|nr:DUF6171 family protein [Lachnospiraceae bacterium]
MQRSEEKGLENRVCYRCLIRELANIDYEETIGKYLDAIATEDKVPDPLYEERLQICKTCEKLIDGTCLSCGCYVELRAASKKAACPLKKW